MADDRFVFEGMKKVDATCGEFLARSLYIHEGREFVLATAVDKLVRTVASQILSEVSTELARRA